MVFSWGFFRSLSKCAQCLIASARAHIHKSTLKSTRTRCLAHSKVTHIAWNRFIHNMKRDCYFPHGAPTRPCFFSLFFSFFFFLLTYIDNFVIDILLSSVREAASKDGDAAKSSTIGSGIISTLIEIFPKTLWCRWFMSMTGNTHTLTDYISPIARRSSCSSPWSSREIWKTRFWYFYLITVARLEIIPKRKIRRRSRGMTNS